VDRTGQGGADFSRENLNSAIRDCSREEAACVLRFLGWLHEVRLVAGTQQRSHSWTEAATASGLSTIASSALSIGDDTVTERARLVGTLVLMGDTIDVLIDCIETESDEARRACAMARRDSALALQALHVDQGGPGTLSWSRRKLEERRVCAVCHALLLPELLRLRVLFERQNRRFPSELDLLLMKDEEARCLPPTWWYALSFEKCPPIVACALVHHVRLLHCAPVYVRNTCAPDLPRAATRRRVKSELSRFYPPHAPRVSPHRLLGRRLNSLRRRWARR
tara:strand:- start:2242 stop:3081 length:840 start_codon:yes stop_codon:yes gene_type:complete